MMLRTLPRVSQTSLLPRTAACSTRCISPLVRYADSKKPTSPQKRHATAHAISNPTLAGIEKRWEGMPPPEQAKLWMALRDRMKTDWHEMTLMEKKAAYWIAFGPHGPRAVPPAGEGRKIFFWTSAAVGLSIAIFVVIRLFARDPPATMTQEYQEMTNEYLKAQNAEPLTGISSEGYAGKGQVQSAPAKKN